VEDLTLTDSKEYPELSRFENCGVNEDTFADVLMIVDFLHAFGEVRWKLHNLFYLHFRNISFLVAKHCSK